MTTEITEEHKEVIQDNKVESFSVEPKLKNTEPLVDNAKLTDAFLVAETERNIEIAKKTWRWGSVAVVVLAIYFTTLISSVRSVVFDADGIAAILSSELDKKLPEQLGMLEGALIAQAPSNARNLVSEITKVLPRVRVEGQNAIEEVSNSIPLLGEEVTSAIKAYVADNREAIQDFAKTHSEQEFANYFMSDLFAHVILDVDTKLKQAGEPGGWNAVKAVSLKRLVALNNYLERLANTGRFDLSEEEQLQRRTIVTWIKLLEE